VVHVIDSVLNPANSTAEPNPSESSGVPAFAGAQDQDDGLASGVPTPTASLNPTSEASAAATATSSSSSGGAMPMITGAIAPAALFGAGAILANL
jgi:transforming growth factor-beta-induced protein